MSDRDKLNEKQRAFREGYNKGYITAEKKWVEILMDNLEDKDRGLMPTLKELAKANVELTEKLENISEEK